MFFYYAPCYYCYHRLYLHLFPYCIFKLLFSYSAIQPQVWNKTRRQCQCNFLTPVFFLISSFLSFSFHVTPNISLKTWLNLLSWRRWRCHSALAAHMAYSVPPSCPVRSKLGSFICCNAQLFADVTYVVHPLLLWSSFEAMTVCVSMYTVSQKKRPTYFLW